MSNELKGWLYCLGGFVILVSIVPLGFRCILILPAIIAINAGTEFWIKARAEREAESKGQETE